MEIFKCLVRACRGCEITATENSDMFCNGFAACENSDQISNIRNLYCLGHYGCSEIIAWDIYGNVFVKHINHVTVWMVLILVEVFIQVVINQCIQVQLKM